MSAVAKFMEQQIKFNLAMQQALRLIQETQDRIESIIRSARPGELSGLEQWNVLSEDVAQVAHDPDKYSDGCNSCWPQVPASRVSEPYRCKSCSTQWAPKLGGDAKWVWIH